jgi:hypothetical protein
VEPPVEPPVDEGQVPATGWPGGVWSDGGRLVAATNFAGDSLPPLFGAGISNKSYGGAPPGYCAQAENQWGVPGVYAPEQLRFGSGHMDIVCDYRPEGFPGPDLNNPCYYATGAICSWPTGYLNQTGPGTAPVGFAWQAGQTDLIFESDFTMQANTAYTWQGHWLCSSPDWRLEHDLWESIGPPPVKGHQTTVHYSNTGGGAGDEQATEGCGATNPKAAPGTSTPRCCTGTARSRCTSTAS